MAMYQDINGERQQLTIDASIYTQASNAGLSVEALINQTHPTRAGEPSAYRQICASEGIYLRGDREFGVRPATMDAILNGPRLEAGSIVRDANPASRILFPSVVLSVLEDQLVPDRSATVNAFDTMVAVDDTINGETFERPILNFSRPEAARSKAIAQLSEPTSMLTITASDKIQKIAGTSIGLEIADQAIRATSLDLVTLAMTRQGVVELAEKVDGYLMSFLNGDIDLGTGSLASLAGKVRTATSFDAAIGNTAGALTQEAWVKFLFNNSKRRTITHIITNIDGAMAIENRTGRPVITSDNGTSKRIDTLENVINPMWPDQVKVFITTDPNWPAHTLLGFDQRWAIHRVTSTSLAYQAAEAYAMRRSTKFRVDVGQIAYRLFEDAWDVLTLV